MKKEKVFESIKERYEKRYPQNSYYTECDLQQIESDIPISVYRFRGLAQNRNTGELLYTSLTVQTNDNDDVIPPHVDIPNNTVSIGKADISFITRSSIYKQKERNLC